MNLENMTKQDLEFVVRQFIAAAEENYRDAALAAGRDEMQAGRQLAYFEMLDMLRSRILAAGGDMEEIKPPV